MSGNIPEPRSHHAAEIIFGNQMIVYGGMNQQNEILNDVHVLDLERMHWRIPHVTGVKPEGRISCICFIFSLICSGTCIAVNYVLFLFAGYDALSSVYSISFS